MLPSMPILFTRDSQDAFGNKIVPSTSVFSQNSAPKADINPEPPPFKPEPGPSTSLQNETKVIKENKKIGPTKASPDRKDSVLDAALVRSYYTKVQSRFSSNQSVPTNKFVQFQSILKSFDPSKETPVDLYKKIELLFGVEHKDFVEDFLLFLKPGQAALVGRFSDHFMLTKMTNFIEMLQVASSKHTGAGTEEIYVPSLWYYDAFSFYGSATEPCRTARDTNDTIENECSLSRKPTVLRKVVRAISTGLAGGGADEMKARVLPHLRSHPKLAQMFRALCPDERPPDSLYESGVDMLNDSFLAGDKGYDIWTLPEDKHSARPLEDKKRLDTVYMHGRVFLQHGRSLRAASVSYPYSKEPYRPRPPASPDKPKLAKKTKKPPKSPTKTIKDLKDVNDNTKHKDALNSPKASKGKNGKKCKNEKTETAPKRDKKALEKSVIESKEAPRPKLAKIEVTATEIKKETKSNWTREEDKTMLQVLKGEASPEQVFGRIQESLPHRSFSEIKERFCHVMSLLQEMAVGEVT